MIVNLRAGIFPENRSAYCHNQPIINSAFFLPLNELTQLLLMSSFQEKSLCGFGLP